MRIRTAPSLAERFAGEADPLDVLSRAARRLTRCDADAEDLLQDTLLNAYTGFHTFQDGTNPKAWLFRILYNRWVSTYRRSSAVQRRSRSRRSAKGTRLGAARLPARPRSAEAAVLEALPDSQIKRPCAICRMAFGTAMYYACIHGYTYAETAAMMNIPQGTAMSRASRASQRLRIALAQRQMA